MTRAERSYGQGHAESVLRSQHWRNVENSAAYLARHLRAGMDVLDIGCGPGTITVDLARRVAPGTVAGIDPSASVLAQARTTAEREGVPNVEFRQGDVLDLGEQTGTFDVVHAHQVLLHLSDPVAALRRMLRLARPGGLVAARDTDYAGAMWWPADPRLDRWLRIYRAVAHSNGTEPDAGRRLLAWAHAAGATDVTPSASIWCHSTPAERAWWGGLWADRILDSRIAEQAIEGGHASRADLADVSAAWTAWAAHPDGWFAIPHGEILCHV
ncbi:methyltransferase domain-containing protein [Pseudonocardia hispaniensis]|uniref:Methyltransferase domain-containing protein n=1 Tax=Pseudonocardia hispaniensis TaxID=904933 RepID=A0ABW1J3C7_9PSEU